MASNGHKPWPHYFNADFLALNSDGKQVPAKPLTTNFMPIYALGIYVSLFTRTKFIAMIKTVTSVLKNTPKVLYSSHLIWHQIWTSVATWWYKATFVLELHSNAACPRMFWCMQNLTQKHLLDCLPHVQDYAYMVNLALRHHPGITG